MTHTPPIPAGNTSPYPLREAPHVHALQPRDDQRSGDVSIQPSTGVGLITATVVLAAAAMIARFWLARSSKATAAVPPRRRPVVKRKVPADG